IHNLDNGNGHPNKYQGDHLSQLSVTNSMAPLHVYTLSQRHNHKKVQALKEG
ncbi:hypothetical protein PIB30_031636, partial [Stylosanthes scabra]|nr:hypothetical protein [Stylosanthes scabra]